jgi:hypothetical protein
MGLTEKKKEALRFFVDYRCEVCGKKQGEKLQIHRINRGYCGGIYVLRNIQVVCPSCHKLLHGKEFK